MYSLSATCFDNQRVITASASNVFLQGLIETPSAVPSYHSLDAVDDEADATELPNVAEDVVVQQPTGGTQSAGSSSSVISILFQFCTHQSYIGMLIIMMVRFIKLLYFW